MTTEIQVSTNEPSQKLRLIITNCASNLVEFASTWEEVRVYGLDEGFTEKQLQSMVVTEIRKQLKEKGFKGYQVDNRIYNYLHAKERSIHNKEQYQKSLLKKGIVQNNEDNKWNPSHINNNNDEQCSSLTDESANEEIARLQTENKELHEIIKNISFNDNPDVFAVNKNSDTFFANVSIVDARAILSTIEDQKKKINIAWEEVKAQ